MHRWSKLFVPTLREAPADAEVASHKFLIRAGYIRQLSAGIYNYLFLGHRSFNKIIAIVRDEMDRIGQEFYLPGILPKEVFDECIHCPNYQKAKAEGKLCCDTPVLVK